jgi:hypothetical protein
MQKFETILGSAVWMALSLVMVFAALEPVQVHAGQMRLVEAAAAACANDAAGLSTLCETNTL